VKSYYQSELECAKTGVMRALQNERLVDTVRRVYDNVAFYKNLMDSKNISPHDIKSVDDLHKLPFIYKETLRDEYPYGLLAAPLSDVVRIHSTSGTTGKRIIAFYTQDDIDLWEECCARSIIAVGGSRDDVVQVSYGYGLFTGGAGLDGGSHKVGAMTLPMSSGNTERQVQFMVDLGATILCCTPSYAAYLAEMINSQGMRDSIKLKAGIFGAEAWSEEMRRDLEKNLGIKAYDIYGLTEITGPGVSFECEEQTGLHVNEDHFIPEIIDSATGEVLPYGEKGELVLTSISKRAFPLIRYRTRDISMLFSNECSCGRTLVKMSRLMGRTDDMLIIRGINVFPSQIEAVLLKSGMTPNYQIIVDRVHHTDTLEVQVEMAPERFSDTVKDISRMERELLAEMKSMLSISPKVTLMAPRSIARSEGKAVRIIDKRKI